MDWSFQRTGGGNQTEFRMRIMGQKLGDTTSSCSSIASVTHDEIVFHRYFYLLVSFAGRFSCFLIRVFFKEFLVVEANLNLGIYFEYPLEKHICRSDVSSTKDHGMYIFLLC